MTPSGAVRGITYERLKREATEQGEGWGPIRAGLIEADAGTLAVYFQ